jgi:hypothetical protein
MFHTGVEIQNMLLLFIEILKKVTNLKNVKNQERAAVR